MALHFSLTGRFYIAVNDYGHLEPKGSSRDDSGPTGSVVLKFWKFGAKFVAHQRPHLVKGVLAGDLATDLGVEVLGAGAGWLAGDGEAVAQHQHAEGQKA